MNITQKYQTIPDVNTLRNHLMLYAKIDFLLSLEDEDEDGAYYHYDDKDWLPGGDYIRVDDGCGDHVHILMTPNGTVIKGFAHESKLSPYNPHLPEWISRHDFFAGLPEELKKEIINPSFEPECTTFVVWAQEGDRWQFAAMAEALNEFDGSAEFLEPLADLASYYNLLTEYYEVELDWAALEKLYHGAPFTESILATLFPEKDPNALLNMLEEKFGNA